LGNKKLLFAFTVVLASALAVLAAGGASAAASGVVGHVYVNDNTGGENTIGAFDRHADGTLMAMPPNAPRTPHLHKFMAVISRHPRLRGSLSMTTSQEEPPLRKRGRQCPSGVRRFPRPPS
jgi:hypothetical protein